MKSEVDNSLILSGVRALLGNVPISLRSVSIELSNGKILWKCVFDENATEEDYELLSIAAGEVIADFPNYGLKEITETIPNFKKPQHFKNLIFQRKENN
ncbi:hypothetical protein AHMF7605_18605 [Adhaeribacter arboris]|uniref:Uncharacterized protein n=1 Tax=Adhaeribacter arboris TaxID=2072846 RepID=A0A2T2YIN9_9BACT|nr:hypothetical protein [Adhaeribacter arboris]PSR55371.1 hypothetical protein AHMF7605_18605 [Adhaeribacter arboris]